MQQVFFKLIMVLTQTENIQEYIQPFSHFTYLNWLVLGLNIGIFFTCAELSEIMKGNLCKYKSCYIISLHQHKMTKLKVSHDSFYVLHTLGSIQ